ncbi:hypothetical protein EDB19DRAFT_1985053 [Suillus lakei]|nr:hypothetical protein EDB19DRAFT_1985053 [Suillus lakei]
MGRKKSLRQVVLSDSSAHSDNNSGIVTPLRLVEPQVNSPSGPWCTKCPNARKGGTVSQLRKVGEAVIDDPARHAGKGRQFVIPDGEPENIMAPSPVKKRTRKKGQKTAVPAVQTPDRLDGAGSALNLHIGETGERFGLQNNPIPLGYVSLQPLGSDHPVCLKSHIQRDRPHSHTHVEVATRPTVQPPVMRAPAAQPTIPHPKPSNPPRRQGQAERPIGRPASGHASRKDHGQNRREDPGKQSQPQAHSNAIAEVPNMDYDVVKWHHKTNCHARSPSPTYLHSVHYSGFTVNQPKTKHACTNNLQSNNNRQATGDSGDMKVDTDSVVRHTGVGCHMKAAKSTQDSAVVAKRKTLGFFLDLWVKLLNYTKACFRLHLAIADPFPACEEALSDTGICLELITESIVAWEVQNCCLEADFYPQYEYDMATVIYNDSINFHSRIKQIAINVVPVEYKLSGSESEIKQKANTLLKSSSFLCGEHDEHDHTSNFVHSGLRSVCLQAFYDGGSKSLQQFPKFHHTIPQKALLLVTTIVCNVIHVYSMYSHINTKQTALGDSEKVYRKLTSMLKQVMDDEYHCEKLDDQTLQSLLLQNLLIGCVHWPAKPGIQDTGRSMQALYRPVYASAV